MYTWVDTHRQIVDYLSTKEDAQSELIELLKSIGITPFNDKAEPGGHDIELDEIDPFTFFCYIYKYGPQRRLKNLQEIARKLDFKIPTDEKGIPSAQAQKVWMFPYKFNRTNNEIPRLWRFFKKAILEKITDDDFADVLNIRNTGKTKLTEALYYVNPEKYLPINGPTIPHLKEEFQIDPKFNTYSEYVEILNTIKSHVNTPFYQFSYEAWERSARGSDISFSENELIKLFRKLGEDAVNTYFTYAEKLIKSLGVKEGDERITYGTRQKNRVSITIGQRYALALINTKDRAWEFISSKERIGNEYMTVDPFKGDGPKAFLYRCDDNYEIDNQFDGMVSASKSELKRSSSSSFKGKNNPTFEKAVFHPAYRAELLQKAFNTESMTPENKIQLNTILYGPPGTGKTYHTVNKALEILGEDISGWSRNDIKEAFDEKVKSGQVVFSTFHQSMSYEDFIEGIKPVINETSNVSYDIETGIFKNISKDAKENWLNANQDDKAKLPFDDAFDQLIEEWSEDPQMKFPLKTKGKDFVILGFTNTSIRFKKSSGGTGHTLSISTLRDFYYNKRDFKPSGVGIYYPPVIEKLNSYQPSSIIKKEVQPYVLIIDEINRGNVSQIFGELITLIEEDKRLGKPEALEVMLPYSKEKFGVPPNLYIIGTMNTADRSVEALDTALRRRFSFIEMPPQPSLLTPAYMVWKLFWDYENYEWDDSAYKPKESQLFDLLGATENFREKEKYELWDSWRDGRSEEQLQDISENDFPGINLSDLLSTINKRIEKLLDPDHLIGHSYFMEVFSLADLKAAFKNKIIPLLQEYFYGDNGKIGLVLGKGFFKNEEPENESSREVFAEFNDYDSSTYAEKPVYKLSKVMEMSDDTFLEAINLLYNK